MKTQPWQLAQQIAGEFRMLESLLTQQARLEIDIVYERARIKKMVTEALEAFSEELKQSATE